MNKHSFFSINLLIACLSVGYFIVIFLHIFLKPDDYQQSFRIYYFAASAYFDNLNPYDSAVLCDLADKSYMFPYVYPPITLYLFYPFILIEYNIAANVFLVLKIISLVLLISVWIKYFKVDNKEYGFFFLFLLCGINFTFYWDISNGNITVFEQLLLWYAFVMFTKKKYATFMLLIMLSAIFKFTLLFFIVLLVLDNFKNNLKLIIVSVCIVLFYVILNYILCYDVWEYYIDKIIYVKDIVSLNNYHNTSYPSLYNMLKIVYLRFIDLGMIVPNKYILQFVYLFASMTIVGITYAQIRNAKSVLEEIDYKQYIIALAVLVYALICPRHAMYSYIIVLLPIYNLITHKKYIYYGILIVLLSAITTNPTMPPGFRLLYGMLYPFYPVILVFIFWIIQLNYKPIYVKYKLRSSL